MMTVCADCGGPARNARTRALLEIGAPASVITCDACGKVRQERHAEADAAELEAKRAEYAHDLTSYEQKLAAWQAAVAVCETAGHDKGPYMYGTREGSGWNCRRCGAKYNDWYGCAEGDGRPQKPLHPDAH